MKTIPEASICNLIELAFCIGSEIILILHLVGFEGPVGVTIRFCVFVMMFTIFMSRLYHLGPSLYFLLIDVTVYVVALEALCSAIHGKEGYDFFRPVTYVKDQVENEQA
jgi:hypothetical protein